MEHNKVRVKIFNILLFWWNLLRLIAEPIDDWMVSYVLVQMSYISKSVTYSPRMKDNIDIDNQERTPLQPRLMHLLEKSKALGGVICVHGAITQQWLSFLISPIAMTLNGQALVSAWQSFIRNVQVIHSISKLNFPWWAISVRWRNFDFSELYLIGSWFLRKKNIGCCA